MKSKFNVAKHTLLKLRSLMRKNTLISIVALILTASLLLSATYAWVESISSIVIENKNSDGTETNIIQIEDRLLTKGTITTTNTNEIDLANYFRAAGNFHLSAASSANGDDIYFPVVNSETAYRQGNINDKNVNYYDFSLRIKLTNGASSPREFRFESVPTINFGSSTGVNSNIRCAITFSGDTTKVYSKNASTASVVNGTTSSTTANESTSTFSSGTTTSIFRITDSNYHRLNIRLWYQNGSGAADDLAKQLKISDFKLIPYVPSFTVTAKAAYLTSGTTYTEGTTGGTVKTTGTGAGSVSVSVQENNKATFTATPASGYRFVGWYAALNGGSAVSTTQSSWQTPAITSDKTYYARFIKTYTLTVSAQYTSNGTSYTSGTTGGTVSPTSSTVDYNGTKTLTATPATGYKFEGWYNSSGTCLSTNTSYTTAAITANTTITGKFKYTAVTIYYYNPDLTSAPYFWYWQDGGDPYAENDGYDYNTLKMAETTCPHAWSFTLTGASVNSNRFKFNHGSTVSGGSGSNVMYNATTSSWTTYPPKHTISVTCTSTFGSVYVDTSGTTSKTVNCNTSVKVVATTNTGYIFDGWYEGDTLKSSSSTWTFNLTEGDLDLTAKYKRYVYVGFVKYVINENKLSTSDITVHYWNDGGLSADSSLNGTKIATVSRSFGSSYWSNAAQDVYVYRAAIPAEATSFGIKKNGTYVNNYDCTISSNNMITLFEYGGSFHYRIDNY